MAVTEIYNRLQIPQIALKAIDHFYEEAYREISGISISEERWKVIWDYAKSLLGRNK